MERRRIPILHSISPSTRFCLLATPLGMTHWFVCVPLDFVGNLNQRGRERNAAPRDFPFVTRTHFYLFPLYHIGP